MRPWGVWLRLRVTRGPQRGGVHFHGARSWGQALLGVRRRGIHGLVRVRIHRSLWGASRGCLPRTVRWGRLGWRGEGRCANYRFPAARTRTGSADRGDNTRVRQTHRRLRPWACPYVRCAGRRADCRVGEDGASRWSAWPGEEGARDGGGAQ